MLDYVIMPQSCCLFQEARIMSNADKSKEQLIEELAALRQRIAELEAWEAQREQARGFCISPPGSSGGLRLPCPLSGKEAHVAVSSSPKNASCWFPINALKPPATSRIDSSGAIVDGRFCADVSNSLLCLCHHPSPALCDEFAVPLR